MRDSRPREIPVPDTSDLRDILYSLPQSVLLAMPELAQVLSGRYAFRREVPGRPTESVTGVLQALAR